MSNITRRTALTRGGQAVAVAAALPVISNIAADAAEGDAELLGLEAQVLRLIDEMNAGLCKNAQGDISDEALTREEWLEAAIARHPARTLEGVAVKLRRQRYWIEEIYCHEDAPRFVASALADLDRLAGRA